ncbi:uncharacterized protein ColSpa_01963 [Colletotrichum spaethianum]|uniref:Uncharacterized protein n=1 Tax=Colletotrichum spaethianum TaxID=700344 RepID=A0AA37NU88_9PEZI|nr:uncharacterized protein ColSpa_01963 [Colletotrichum spaethianum]GKT41782.1 hypothetical protein ColSpa_01963 [Colletotrichum spaethianum]
MGLITGLVSTVVHVAAGRNPYGHNHNQTAQPTNGYQTAPRTVHHENNAVCSAGPDGQPCGICAVALPFGKGRQAKAERRAMKYERRAVKHAMKAQRYCGARGSGCGSKYTTATPYQQQQYQRDMAHGGRQEEGVEEWQERRRASTGENVPPPAYEEGESSAVAARRSVEVLGGDEKHAVKA